MTRLEDLQPTATVRGIAPDGLVTVVSVQWFGSEAHHIRVAHLFGTGLAVHASQVEPFPHQITAVYAAMLPCQPRWLLPAGAVGADGGGMADLLANHDRRKEPR